MNRHRSCQENLSKQAHETNTLAHTHTHTHTHTHKPINTVQVALILEDDAVPDLAPWWPLSLESFAHALPEGWHAAQLEWTTDHRSAFHKYEFTTKSSDDAVNSSALSSSSSSSSATADSQSQSQSQSPRADETRPYAPGSGWGTVACTSIR